jgi:hypothetical protein
MGEWTEEDEAFVLHSTDTIGSMYRIDSDRYKSLTEMVRQNEQKLKGIKTSKAIEKLHSGAANLARRIEEGLSDATPLPISNLSTRKKPEPRVSQDDLEDGYVPDSEDVTEVVSLENVYFQGDGEWQIPMLLPELLCTPDMVPDRVFDRTPESATETAWYCISSQRWAEREEQGVVGGILGNFCEDYHFAGFYDNPSLYIEQLKDWDFSALALPDFSTFADWPFPRRLWQLYKSRWVGRYWQGHGLRVLPILQSIKLHLNDAERDYDIALETLIDLCPPVVACQCRTIKHQGGSFEEFGYWLSNQVNHIKPEIVIVYGGNEHFAKFEGFLPLSVPIGKNRKRKVRYVYLPSFMERRRKLIKKE